MRRASKKLTMVDVEAQLAPLETVEDAMQRLDRIGLWALGGLLAGTVAGAAVRSVEVWLRGHESKLTEQVVSDLKGELDRVKADLKRPGVRAS